MDISHLTRRDIADAVTIEEINWSGRLDEHEFLSRIFDLNSLPSHDSRFPNMAGDIWQHRVNNPYDWEDDWVFYDDRLNLPACDDDEYLLFLCEMVHPVVRSDSIEAQKIVQLFNSFLCNDGFELVEKARISNKPVYVGRRMGADKLPGITVAKDTLARIDSSYVSQQITRMEAAIENDPTLAIGTSKELVETCCKTLLEERGAEIPKNSDLPQLVKLAVKELQLTPDDIPDSAKASTTIKKLLSNLATITQGIAELRNSYGTGHGKSAKTGGLKPRHAKLAVGAASTLSVFLMETHSHRE